MPDMRSVLQPRVGLSDYTKPATRAALEGVDATAQPDGMIYGSA